VLEGAGSIVVILPVLNMVAKFSANPSDQIDIIAEKIEKLNAEEGVEFFANRRGLWAVNRAYHFLVALMIL